MSCGIELVGIYKKYGLWFTKERVNSAHITIVRDNDSVELKACPYWSVSQAHQITCTLRNQSTR